MSGTVTALTGDEIRAQVSALDFTIFSTGFAYENDVFDSQGTVAAPTSTETPALLTITADPNATTPPSALNVAPGYTYIENYNSATTVVLSGNDSTQGPLYYEGDSSGQTVFLGTGDAYASMTGFGNTISTASVGGGTYEIVAGIQNAQADPFALAPTIAGADGNALGNTIVAASGNVNVAAGLGANVIILGTGIGVVASEGTDTILGGSGSDNILASGNATVFQGTGDMFFANGGGSSVIVGSADPAAAPLTVAGGTGSVIAFGTNNGGDLLAGGTGGGNVLVANGAGDSLFGGASANGPGDLLVGYGGDLLQAGAGNTTLFGGNGDSLYGGSGNDVFVDGTGDTVQAGTGADQIFAGAGSDDLLFANGQAGGTDLVAGFDTSADFLTLSGYGANAAQMVLANETVSGGNTMLALPDNTSITLYGVSDLTAANFHTT